jgi:hypothetical protein
MHAIIDTKKEMNVAVVKGEVSEDREAPKRRKKPVEAKSADTEE